MRLRTFLLTALAAFAVSGAAQAAPVTGSIQLSGFAESNTAGFGTATGISFANAAGTSVSGTSGQLSGFSGGTGTFSSIGSCSSGVCGTIKDIASFSPSMQSIGSFLTLNTGSATTVSFDLTQVTGISESGATAGGGSLTLTVAGTINVTGFNPTNGIFTLTAMGNTITSLSATSLSAVTSVPEPASLAILGGSLAAVGFVRRRKNG